MHVLVTGSSGLIGSEAVTFFHDMGCRVTGVDNNMRASFFGPKGDTTWNRQRLEAMCKHFEHIELDIRKRDDVCKLFRAQRFDLIVHAAAQPSHDLAAQRPFEDFDVNAGGTLNLLEAYRRHSPKASFVYLSTNKVYGDGPNNIPLQELETRWDYNDPAFAEGIDETFPVDRCLHSLFGASKLAGDIYTQEYGRYFGLSTGIFRGGCLTGTQHAGVELHGFLNYLIRVALRGETYTIFGYKGKQVRDQMHSYDVISAIWHFAQSPRCGEVYNIGGGKDNAFSILECMVKIEEVTGKRPQVAYTEENRVGDHICYYTDMRKFCAHYPDWRLTYDFDSILAAITQAVRDQAHT